MRMYLYTPYNKSGREYPTRVGSPVCYCCGSTWNGKLKARQEANTKFGISLYAGVAEEQDTNDTLVKVIETKNGPITAAIRKVW